MKLILSVEAVRFPLTGIGRYTWELARHLSLQADVESLLYFTGTDFIKDLPIAGEQSNQQHKLKRLLQKSRVVNKVYRLLMPKVKKQVLKGKEDYLYHGPNFFVPPFAGKKIATFHDLSPFTWPECHPPQRVEHAQKEAPKTLETADALIVDAEYIRQELASYFSYPVDKIFTVPLAASEEFRPYSESETLPILAHYGLLHNQYTFFAGTIEPRKNIMTLMDAYEQLPQALRQRFPLVLSGYEGWRSEAIHQRIDQASRSGWLKYLGFTSAEHLPALYAGARLFAFPSLYEGFGLPILEAMSSGVPVICSNSSTLPEVAGDAALMAAPLDVDAWTQLLHQGLTDEAWRQEARVRGHLRAAQFSWARCAAQTMAVYQAVNAA